MDIRTELPPKPKAPVDPLKEDLVCSEEDVLVAEQIFKHFMRTFDKKKMPETMQKIRYKNAIRFTVAMIGKYMGKK